MKPALLTVPLSAIRVKPQVRKHFDGAALQGLAKSIAETGLQLPLLCIKENDGYLLVDGERRLRACRMLEFKEVPILVASDQATAVDLLTRQLVCNLQREDLTVLERAESIQALMTQASLRAEQAAKRLGLSPATVSRTLAVLKLPEAMLAQVADGRISADAAYLLARVDEPQEREALANDVVSGRLTRDALSRKLRRVQRSEEAQGAGPARITAVLGEGRSITIAGKSLTLDAVIEWAEQLLTRAKKSRSQGLSLETFVRTLRDQARA